MAEKDDILKRIQKANAAAGKQAFNALRAAPASEVGLINDAAIKATRSGGVPGYGGGAKATTLARGLGNVIGGVAAPVMAGYEANNLLNTVSGHSSVPILPENPTIKDRLGYAFDPSYKGVGMTKAQPGSWVDDTVNYWTGPGTVIDDAAKYWGIGQNGQAEQGTRTPHDIPAVATPASMQNQQAMQQPGQSPAATPRAMANQAQGQQPQNAGVSVTDTAGNPLNGQAPGPNNSFGVSVMDANGNYLGGANPNGQFIQPGGLEELNQLQQGWKPPRYAEEVSANDEGYSMRNEAAYALAEKMGKTDLMPNISPNEFNDYSFLNESELQKEIENVRLKRREGIRQRVHNEFLGPDPSTPEGLQEMRRRVNQAGRESGKLFTGPTTSWQQKYNQDYMAENLPKAKERWDRYQAILQEDPDYISNSLDGRGYGVLSVQDEARIKKSMDAAGVSPDQYRRGPDSKYAMRKPGERIDDSVKNPYEVVTFKDYSNPTATSYGKNGEVLAFGKTKYRLRGAPQGQAFDSYEEAAMGRSLQNEMAKETINKEHASARKDLEEAKAWGRGDRAGSSAADKVTIKEKPNPDGTNDLVTFRGDKPTGYYSDSDLKALNQGGGQGAPGTDIPEFSPEQIQENRKLWDASPDALEQARKLYHAETGAEKRRALLSRLIKAYGLSDEESQSIRRN